MKLKVNRGQTPISRFMKLGSVPYLLFFSLLAGLFLQAPAALLNPPLQHASGNRLQLAEPSGTIWSGEAKLLCRVADISSSCGQLAWQLDLSRRALHVRSRQAGESLLASFSRDGWRLDQINITLPAALLGSFDEKLAALGLGGRLRLTGQDLTNNTGELQVRWQQASTRLIPTVALGEHVLDFTNRPEGKSFVVGTLHGPLQLAGNGLLAQDGSVQLDMTVRVTSDASKLSPLLTMLGRATGPGQFHLRLPAS